MIRSARARLAVALALSTGTALVLHVTGHGSTIADVVAGFLLAETLTEWVAAGAAPQPAAPDTPREDPTT